jgi:serine/threonine protein kinase
VIQVVDRIERLHKTGFIHCNVSPESLYIGLNDLCKLHLCDFYYATHIQNSKVTLRKKLVYNEADLKGNAAFASDSACLGYPKTKQDDIQSAIILLIYLLENFKLPWLPIQDNPDTS